ncbi:MAG: hypothetical protein IKG27_00265 [Bacilli bacterium]|nr:hypothetical protein [Bacilli bacterium]
MDNERKINLLFESLRKAFERDEQRIDETKDNKRRKELKIKLETIKKVFYRLEYYGRPSKSEIDKYSRIYTMVENIRRAYQQNSSANSLFDTFGKEMDVVRRKYDKEIEEQRKIFDSVNKKSVVDRLTLSGATLKGYVPTYHMVDGKKISGATLTYEQVFKSLEQMMHAKCYRLLTDKEMGMKETVTSYSHELKIIQEYESNKKISRVKPQAKGFTGRVSGFINGEYINTGKEAILKYDDHEKKIQQLETLIEELKSNMHEFGETYQKAVQLLTKEKEALRKAQEEFENSDYKRVEQAVMSHRKKEIKGRTADDYAKINAQLEYLRKTDPNNKEEIIRLENELAEMAKDMTEEEIRIAIMESKDLTSDKIMADRRREEEQRLSEGYTEPEKPVEVQTPKPTATNPYKRELESEQFRVRHHVNRLKSLDGRTRDPELNEEYYFQTASMSEGERALQSLIRIGMIPAGKTLDNLTPEENQMVNAQIVNEASVSQALEKYAEVKEQYDKFMSDSRASKMRQSSRTQGGISR